MIGAFEIIGGADGMMLIRLAETAEMQRKRIETGEVENRPLMLVTDEVFQFLLHNWGKR